MIYGNMICIIHTPYLLLKQGTIFHFELLMFSTIYELFIIMCNRKQHEKTKLHCGLSVCMWNVNGLVCAKRQYNKIEDSIFHKIIKDHDIIALVETKISPEVNIQMEGYHLCRMDRPKSSNSRHYGGWALYINKGLKNGIKILEQTPDYAWLHVSKDFFLLPYDIYM